MADRGNTQLSHYQDPLSPAVIRAISKVIDVGREHNIEVSVCGEMASDPVAALVFIYWVSKRLACLQTQHLLYFIQLQRIMI